MVHNNEPMEPFRAGITELRNSPLFIVTFSALAALLLYIKQETSSGEQHDQVKHGSHRASYSRPCRTRIAGTGPGWSADALGVPRIGTLTDRRYWILPSLLPIGTEYLPPTQASVLDQPS